jgi:hypothetical protein
VTLVCECCAVPQCPPLVARVDGFVCQCAIEPWCRRCKRCVTHCHCAAVPDLDVSWSERLAVAKDELRRMGVPV